MIADLLKIGPRVTALPVVHGSGDFAWEVRRLMMLHEFDALAVPLPPSFQSQVEAAIVQLPVPSVVVQRESRRYQTQWRPPGVSPDMGGEDEDDFEDDSEPGLSYVPIDPCQPVIAALRTAMGERMPRFFIDCETSHYRPHARSLPDAYALKRLPIERFAAAVLPQLEPADDPQWRRRIDTMAWQLKQLSIDYQHILFVPSILDWPWIRQSFFDRSVSRADDEPVDEVESYQLNHDSLYFLLGELPLITDRYEQARSELEDDANLSIDGIKELLLVARDAYQADYQNRARKISPKLLSQMLKYIRNLTLIDHRFTPQLATIVTAAQQVAGDGYALHVLEQAKTYRFTRDLGLPEARMGIDQMALPDQEILKATSRLPGPPIVWSRLELIPKPDTRQRSDWQQRWNPYAQCSWPPEDEQIEKFRATVFDRANEVLGAGLAQTEKFTTSIKDGIDIRETVRHWHDGEIHVKVLPPARGKLDAAVMLFDSPADPRDYPWRTTWFAEHENESTLAFYASDFTEQPVGPGICLAHYGGALFLYPPLAIPDVWQDPRLDGATTLEERILLAACLHAESPHIALVSPAPPGPAWRQIARRYKKTWIHLPLSRFSDSTVQQLRMVHVLNGTEVRSHAAHFIRKV